MITQNKYILEAPFTMLIIAVAWIEPQPTNNLSNDKSIYSSLFHNIRIKDGVMMKYKKTNDLVEQVKLPFDTILEIVSLRQEVTERPVNYETGMISTTYAGKFGMREIGNESSETMLVVALNAKYQVNAMSKIFRGTLSSTVAHPREIFQIALLNNAHSIMVFHNHPSGSLEPSEADLDFTERLIEAGDLLGIPLLDHIIVSHENHLSLRSEGHF